MRYRYNIEFNSLVGRIWFTELKSWTFTVHRKFLQLMNPLLAWTTASKLKGIRIRTARNGDHYVNSQLEPCICCAKVKPKVIHMGFVIVAWGNWKSMFLCRVGAGGVAMKYCLSSVQERIQAYDFLLTPPLLACTESLRLNIQQPRTAVSQKVHHVCEKNALVTTYKPARQQMWTAFHPSLHWRNPFTRTSDWCGVYRLYVCSL